MLLKDLLFPEHLLQLANDLKKCENSVLAGVGGELNVVVPVALLRNLLVAAGAVDSQEIEKMNDVALENESNPIAREFVADNQSFNPSHDKVIVEDVPFSGGNAIRDLMEWKGISLKAVAEKYGGKSAASNLANFLAKTNEELLGLRSSTLEKIANALSLPREVLEALIESRRNLV